MMFQRFAACIVIAAACVCSSAQAGNESHVTDAPQPFNQDKRADTNTGEGFSGDAGHVARLDDFRGKVVLLSFWASWCAPCRYELASLDRLQAMMGGADFIVVPISVDGSESAIKSTYTSYGVSHLGIYRELSDSLPTQLGVDRVPTNIVINRDGRIVRVSTGATQWDAPQTVEMIRSLIRTKNALPGREAEVMAVIGLPHRSNPRAFFMPAAATAVPDDQRESRQNSE